MKKKPLPTRAVRGGSDFFYEVERFGRRTAAPSHRDTVYRAHRRAGASRPSLLMKKKPLPTRAVRGGSDFFYEVERFGRRTVAPSHRVPRRRA